MTSPTTRKRNARKLERELKHFLATPGDFQAGPAMVSLLRDVSIRACQHQAPWKDRYVSRFGLVSVKKTTRDLVEIHIHEQRQTLRIAPGGRRW